MIYFCICSTWWSNICTENMRYQFIILLENGPEVQATLKRSPGPRTSAVDKIAHQEFHKGPAKVFAIWSLREFHIPLKKSSCCCINGRKQNRSQCKVNTFESLIKTLSRRCLKQISPKMRKTFHQETPQQFYHLFRNGRSYLKPFSPCISSVWYLRRKFGALLWWHCRSQRLHEQLLAISASHVVHVIPCYHFRVVICICSFPGITVYSSVNNNSKKVSLCHIHIFEWNSSVI